MNAFINMSMFMDMFTHIGLNINVNKDINTLAAVRVRQGSVHG